MKTTFIGLNAGTCYVPGNLLNKFVYPNKDYDFNTLSRKHLVVYV